MNWISVDDRLPDERVDVMVKGKDWSDFSWRAH